MKEVSSKVRQGVEEAAGIIDEAKQAAEQIISEARNKVKRTIEESDRVIAEARQKAQQVIEEAEERAREANALRDKLTG